jgi:hypothetical protein
VPESTLSLTVNDFIGQVGLFLGWGRGATFGDPAYSPTQQAQLNAIVASGLRQFYFPEPMEGSQSSYDWSFLKPVGTLDLAAASKVVRLPDDFGGFEDRIAITLTGSLGGQSYWPVDLLPIGAIYAQEARYPTTTGRPLMCCLEPLKGSGGVVGGQRFQLHFWPTADGEYTLKFQYYILADFLTGATPYAYGGMAHAETILESCLSVAEERLDDAQTVHRMKYQTRLMASISLDRRLNPQKLGYMDDKSDWRGLQRRGWRDWNPISYNGTVY